MLMLECSQSAGWPLFRHCEIPEFLRLFAAVVPHCVTSITHIILSVLLVHYSHIVLFSIFKQEIQHLQQSAAYQCSPKYDVSTKQFSPTRFSLNFGCYDISLTAVELLDNSVFFRQVVTTELSWISHCSIYPREGLDMPTGIITYRNLFWL